VPFQWLHDSTPLLGLSEPGFDVGVLEMSLSFLGGRTLASLTAEETRNPVKAWGFLMDLEPGMWSSTPTVLRIFLNHPRFDAAHLTRLKDFLLIGEAVTPDLVEKLRRRFPDATLWNGYGPTEASVIVTLEEIDLSSYIYPQEISIGRPLAHAEVDLIENEIWISGPALSPGYLGGVVSEAFRADHENVWFASGDGAHVNEDGKFYYRERLTREFKVSGHRISLGEVEELILRQPGVTHAAVLPWPDASNARGLDAFVKCDTPAMVATALAQFLPEPAVPRRFIEVRDWPLNSNGKTNFAALTQLATPTPAEAHPAPATERSDEPPELR
jgi:D-alanine--poly(phosphoribitol) ligase subunit 1